MHHVMLPIHSGCTPTFRSSSLLASETLVRRGKLAGQKPRYNNCRSSSLFLPLDLMSGSWSPVLPQESRQGSWALFTLFSSTSMSCHSSQFLQKNSRIRNGALGPIAVCLTPGFRPPGTWGKPGEKKKSNNLIIATTCLPSLLWSWLLPGAKLADWINQ